MTERVEVTDDQIRQVCNENDPRDAIVMTLNFMQRMTIALEGINRSLNEVPAVLFEPVAADDTSTDTKSDI